MKKRSFSDIRSKKKAPELIFGWDWERTIDTKDEDKLVLPLWEEMESIKKFLTKEEKIIIELLRQGKSPQDVSEVMRYYDRGDARKRIIRTLRIAKFYTKWRKEIEELNHDQLRCLVPGHQRIVLLFVKERLVYRKIAERTGYNSTIITGLYQFAIETIRKSGLRKIANLLTECWDLSELRRDEMEDCRMDAWRTRLKNGLLCMTGKVPYEWGGQKVILGKGGVADCSGLVIELLKQQNIFKANMKDLTAQGLAKYCGRRKGKPKVGDLVFYGRNKNSIIHVMFYLGEVEIGGMSYSDTVIGMSGGKKHMKKEDAMLLGANLWLKKSSRYRRDFLFYGKVD